MTVWHVHPFLVKLGMHKQVSVPNGLSWALGVIIQFMVILNRNKPKEYPQQPETKIVAKHAMSEVCLLPRPSYSRGRAYKAQSQHKHFMKNRFSKSVRNTVAKILFPKNCCPPHSSLHLPNIHHPHLMSFTSPTSSIPSSTPSSLDLHLHLHHHHHHYHHHHHHHHHHLHLSHLHYLHHHIFHQPHLYDMLYLQYIHYLHHHLHHYILYITHIIYIFCTIFPTSSWLSSPSPPPSSISPTPSTSPTQSFSINLIYMIYITYNAYITYIIIYITASYTSPTSSNLSNLTSLTTSSSSSTT